MSQQENKIKLVQDLEQRIDKMQDMSDAELGTFNKFDWIILIFFSIIIPAIALVAAR